MTAYLDHGATTPLRPAVFAAMEPWLTEQFGNPSGSHAFARRAKQAVEESRDVMAEVLGCRPAEVIFTSGGTEADNLAVLGARGKGTVVCSAIEHDAVLAATRSVEHRIAAATRAGTIDLDSLAGVLDDSVTVVSIMLVNNEVGTVQPLADVADLLSSKAPNAVLHTDAVAAFPWLDVATAAGCASLVSVTAHKFGGPKGVGALVARDVTLAARQLGGGQERGVRSGTLNVAGIIGMATAARITADTRPATARRVARLRDRLADGLIESVPGCTETAKRIEQVPGNCHVRFDGIENEALLFLLDEAGICASAGSACASGAMEPSHVLTAMGLSNAEALSSIRFTLGHTTTEDEVDLALKALPDAVARLRKA
ncbi:MAG TPA: cysteine desulfurase family protein [Acidimicrobiales bacterium]|nr:cysteine desulfurase family protein [Acidimicrobiales bacterium]